MSKAEIEFTFRGDDGERETLNLCISDERFARKLVQAISEGSILQMVLQTHAELYGREVHKVKLQRST